MIITGIKFPPVNNEFFLLYPLPHSNHLTADIKQDKAVFVSLIIIDPYGGHIRERVGKYNQSPHFLGIIQDTGCLKLVIFHVGKGMTVRPCTCFFPFGGVTGFILHTGYTVVELFTQSIGTVVFIHPQVARNFIQVIKARGV